MLDVYVKMNKRAYPKYKIQNKDIDKGLRVKNIEDKMRKNYLHWFVHEQRKPKCTNKRVEGENF